MVSKAEEPLTLGDPSGELGNRRPVLLCRATTNQGYHPQWSTNGGGERQGIDFAFLLGVLRRRILVIFAFLVSGIGFGWIAQHHIKASYTSSASLLLEPKRTDSFGADTQFGSMYVDEAKIASVVSVIESSNLLSRVVESEHLDRLDEIDPQRTGGPRWLELRKPAKVQRPDPDARLDQALNWLERAVRVQRVGLTYVVTIDVRAPAPKLAQRLAGAIANAYLADQVERKTAATQRDTAWLKDRLNAVRDQLEHSEEALDATRRKYGLLETALGSGATMDRQALTELNAQLTQAQIEVTNFRARYEQTERARASGKLDGLPELTDSRVVTDIRGKQADTAKELSSLSAVYGRNYPEVLRLQQGQRILQQQLDAEVSRIVETQRNQYQAAVARERMMSNRLQQAVAAQDSNAGDEGHERVRNAIRVVDANRGLYDALLTRWREVVQQQQREEPEARIISPANLPDRPSFPKPLLLPAGGAVIALLVSLAVVLLPHLFDRRFATVTAVEQGLGLPVLGAAPMLRRHELRTRKRTQTILEFTSEQPLSRFVENLRMLRAFLQISADAQGTVLQVTSAASGEGKSTMAAALAISAATAGVRTVLVDADVRSSSVSALFKLQHTKGLTDVLEHGEPVRLVLRKLGELPLAVLASGRAPLPRPDLIHSTQFGALLEELSQSFGLVVLDGPPVLAVSDSLVMSKYAHATILVLQWHATPRSAAEQAVKMLRMVNARIAGVLLNKINPSNLSRYEGGYSEYRFDNTT